MEEKNSIEELIEKLKRTQNEIEARLDDLVEEQKKKFQYQIKKGKIIFDRTMSRLHKEQKTSSFSYLLGSKLSSILSAPIIYAMVIPIAFMDLTITIYQNICFRVYKIPIIRRSDYIVIDRQHLAYLNLIEKFNCVYCGYGNGVIAYAREVISRTEQYWCPIKHAKKHEWQHARTDKYFEYGDAETYRKRLDEIRKDWHE